MTSQTIPCPNCKAQIPFDPQQLLMGVQFSCPDCDSKIALSHESREITGEAMNNYERIKRDASGKK